MQLEVFPMQPQVKSLQNARGLLLLLLQVLNLRLRLLRPLCCFIVI